MRIRDLPTPALIIDATVLAQNIETMSTALPGAALRPHVKAHKCTALAAVQAAAGHRSFTCATPREVLGMAANGLGEDLLLANESVDPARLRAMAAAQDSARITIAVDSVSTIDAAAAAGLHEVLIDVDVGLPRCGCAPRDAGRLAAHARAAGLTVRGVMGYEGHLMMVTDREAKRAKVAEAMDLLLRASGDVGGDIVSAGGTGTFDLHDGVTEVQAGSYALMDTQYGTLGLPFAQACFVVGTVVSSNPRHAVVDVGLKALGMDHGNPAATTWMEDAGSDGAAGGIGAGTSTDVWFCSDEHVTISSVPGRTDVDARVLITPAHIDPTMAMHEVAWLVRDGEVIDRWPIDLRGW
ncbi:MAG: putative amino acid aldolase or racemase [Acidimicrobiales bacterium]|nr:putative amino acid aldolase or racemase [Acidimicrobiales bacterium]